MSVLSDIIKKCRTAMRAGIPILYIKTDSYPLMKQIVESEELVTLLSKMPGGKYRPFSEQKAKGFKSDPDNWDKDKMTNYVNWNCPHIVTIPVTQDYKEAELIPYIRSYTESYYGNESMDEASFFKFLKASAVILYSSQVNVSRRILSNCEVIDVDYPDYEEILEISQKIINRSGQKINTASMQQLSSLLQGFHQEEIQYTLNKVLTREMKDNKSSLLEDTVKNRKTGKTEIRLSHEVKKIIQQQKKLRLQDESQILKLISPGEEKIGGMENLTNYVDYIANQKLLEDAGYNARNYGVRAPKGILLCGIPGCGKSLAAKLTAQKLDLPLLQMDVGNLMGGTLGQSEENMHRALGQVEAMAPCILWIDELEKGFSGASSNGSSDGGTFKRMFATLLNWMQENRKPCYIFATANDIGGLPKELFRSGRFDELFGVYLPTADECADIFVTSIQNAVKETKKYREEKGAAPLFEKSVDDKALYLNIMNKYFVNEHDEITTPRIVIGADINKIINLTLAEFCQDITDSTHVGITKNEWIETLEKMISSCSVYGDSSENMDSVAMGYCRMLRKGLKPTVKTPLFSSSDYHYERAFKKENAPSSESTESAEKDKFEPILDKKEVTCFKHNYDQAVYQFLYDKINDIAQEVERYERKKMVEG